MVKQKSRKDKFCLIVTNLGGGFWLRDKAKTVADFRKALSVILPVELGLDADQAADILGTSRRCCCKSIEQEREFLSPWEVKAAAGGVPSVPPIHAALVQRLGHDTPMSTTYRLLALHGWRKVQPDTKHPKSDPARQDEFKKNCPKRWLLPIRKTSTGYRCA